MPYIQQVFVDIRGVEHVEKQLFLENRLRDMEKSNHWSYISQVYPRGQLFIKVGYALIKSKNYI